MTISIASTINAQVLKLGSSVRWGGPFSPNGLQGSLPTPPLFGQIIVRTTQPNANPALVDVIFNNDGTMTAVPLELQGLQVGWNNGKTQNISFQPGMVTEIAEVQSGDPDVGAAFVQLLGRTVQLGNFPAVPPAQLPNSGTRSRGVVLSVYKLLALDPTSPIPPQLALVALVRTASPPNFQRAEAPVFYEIPVSALNVLKSA